MRKPAVAVVIALLGSCATSRVGERPPALAPAPVVSVEEARTIALARVPGTIEHEKVRTTKKGNLEYNFKIRPTGATDADPLKKVVVQGKSGKVEKVKDVKRKAPGARDDADGDQD